MADVAVAAQAGRFFAAAVGFNGVDDGRVTFAAGLFRDGAVAGRDAQRIGKVARGEIQRVEEAVLGLDGVFGDGAGRRVAVVAGGDRAMAGFEPCVIMFLHDVAVRAGLGIVGHVGATLGIHECEKAAANRDSEGKPGADPPKLGLGGQLVHQREHSWNGSARTIWKAQSFDSHQSLRRIATIPVRNVSLVSQ
jgi:hypothetical protein